ncbi:MAG: hypothetical protein H7289_07555 [Mucilaginibacter sp.]|nr:hypothetical protein [Mucilaginibacter sp.]
MKTIYYITQSGISIYTIGAIIISFIALCISFTNFYYQYVKKKSRIIFNHLDDYDHNPLKNIIVLSNPGNTEVLITGMSYYFVSPDPNIASEIIIKDSDPIFPILIKPKDISSINILSQANLLNDKHSAYKSSDNELLFKVHLTIDTILYNGEMKKSNIKLFDLRYGLSDKISQSLGGPSCSNGINILDKKYSKTSR